MELEKIKTLRKEMLTEILATKDRDKILVFLEEYGLEIRDGRIFPKAEFEHLYDLSTEHFDKLQLVTKISLNSSYGALLNAGSRFFDKRLGQSTTLTGRTITRHMCAKTNEIICGNYDYQGENIIYGDTDSVHGSSVISTNKFDATIENLYNRCMTKWVDGDKEYAYDPDLMVMSYDPGLDEPYFGHIEYIYRHRVSKKMYEIEDAFGNTVTVTEDHSVMVERDGILLEMKPNEIEENDIILTIKIESDG